MQKKRETQAEYYKRTASNYNEMHVREKDEHFIALRYISHFLPTLQASNILDVGSGTGRAIKYFIKNHPEIKVKGVEPVKELINQAIKNNVPPESIVFGCGEHLPFDDSSFDIVCAFGVMHHIKNSKTALKEMMRVAKKAIFISDSNRFAQGSFFARWLKLLLYKTKLWGIADLIKTKGKGYSSSEGDGISYSYSVYDSYNDLAKWADTIILLPTSKTSCAQINSWLNPLITSQHILLCAVKNQ